MHQYDQIYDEIDDEIDDDEIDELLHYEIGRGMHSKYGTCVMFHRNPDPNSGWDEWENNIYLRDYKPCLLRWQARVSFAHRLIKLYEKRKIKPNYCNKSEVNYKKYFEKGRSNYYGFKYVGTKYL